jgi:hypothetical protein
MLDRESGPTEQVLHLKSKQVPQSKGVDQNVPRVRQDASCVRHAIVITCSKAS